MKINALLFALILPASVGMAAPQVGTVAIYSDGQAEKLLEIGDGWTLWEDQRKRRYKKSSLPILPFLSYQRFPDQSNGYTQQLTYGRPQSLIPFGESVAVRFNLRRSAGTSGSTRHWTCEYSGKDRFKLSKRKYKTYDYRCVRAIYKKGTYFRLRETVDIKYSPTLDLVVDRKRTDRYGNVQRVKLHRMLSPQKATSKRISRTVYGLRKSK